MNTLTLHPRYPIGEKIKMGDRVYTVIGYEHVPKRALRYILAHFIDGAIRWEYFYEFEIKLMQK